MPQYDYNFLKIE